MNIMKNRHVKLLLLHNNIRIAYCIVYTYFYTSIHTKINIYNTNTYVCTNIAMQVYMCMLIMMTLRTENGLTLCLYL